MRNTAQFDLDRPGYRKPVKLHVAKLGGRCYFTSEAVRFFADHPPL